MRLRWLAPGLSALFMTSIGAGPLLAAPPQVVARHTTFEDRFVDTETCPGAVIEERIEGFRNRTEYYALDGSLRRVVINVTYRIWMTNVEQPELTVTTPGHRHITLDVANGTFTDTGVLRNVTASGFGTIILVAGRLVEDLDTEELLSVNGPRLADVAAYCASLGG